MDDPDGFCASMSNCPAGEGCIVSSDHGHSGMGLQGEPMGGDGTDWTDPGAGGDACATCMAACATDADPSVCMGGCLDEYGDFCMAGGGRR